MTKSIIRVGIVGDGGNASRHIRYAHSYRRTRVVGIVGEVDRQGGGPVHTAGKRFATLRDLLAHEQPDVVHIASTPTSNFTLIREALERGCHVLAENQMALNKADAIALFQLAEQRAVRLCFMSEYLLEPCIVKVRNIIQSEEFGEITKVEWRSNIDPRMPALRDYPAPNVLPPLYEFPGGIYQFFLASPLYIILGIAGSPRSLTVLQESRGFLFQDMPDRLRIAMDGVRHAACLALSFEGRQPRNSLAVHGSGGSIVVDIDAGVVEVHYGSRSDPTLVQAFNYAGTIWRLFRKKWMGIQGCSDGVQNLIHAFYDSIGHDRTTPVSMADTIAVIEAIDEIRARIKLPLLDFAPVLWQQYSYPITKKYKILITGATGFLGGRLAMRLASEGYRIRALARKLADVSSLKALGAEIVFGDVGDRSSVDSAMHDVDIVVHAAAGTSGTERDSYTGTIQGTRNVLEACRENRIKKLVHISSCSVYDVVGHTGHLPITEQSQLDPFPLRRGPYSASKQQADALVAQAINHESCAIVILRPGTLYGPGTEVYTRMMGVSLARRIFVVFGDGKSELPLVHVDNAVDAIVESIGNDSANGKVFNVLDHDQVTKRVYMERIVKPLYPTAIVVYCPMFLLFILTWSQEKLMAILGRQPPLTVYRLMSSQKRVRYSSSKIENGLGWRPRIGFFQGAKQLIGEHKRAADTV